MSSFIFRDFVPRIKKNSTIFRDCEYENENEVLSRLNIWISDNKEINPDGMWIESIYNSNQHLARHPNFAAFRLWYKI